MKPITPPISCSIEVEAPREEVFAFLDVMANHEPFMDHMLTDWEYSGPDRGVGSRVRVKAKAGGITDVVEIETVAAEPPAKIVEENTGAGGRRIANGTYLLHDRADGRGTRIVFEYAWKQAPLSERLAAPLVRAVTRRGIQRGLQRLPAQLEAYRERSEGDARAA